MRSILKSFGPSRGRPACEPGRALRELLEVSTDPLLTLDGGGAVTGSNAAARELLGCEPVGRPIGRYLPAWRGLRDAGAGLVAVAGRVHELTAVRESGRDFPAEVRLSLGAGEGDGLALLHVRDATERARRLEELERLALHDALTGLPNRLLLDDRLRQGLLQAQRRGEPLAVLLLDLNGFKQVNDTLGHHMGDRLLQQLAPRLAGPLRKSDTLARLGGDEFAVLLAPPTDLEEAGRAAERLVASLAEPFTIDGARLEVGASVGVALYPDHGVDAAELLRRADAAMYAAKRSGLGFAVCDHHDVGSVLRRRGLRRDLQEAIENDGLTLLFQPKVRARDHEPAGVEALVAWRHPEHGLLRAPDFLPLAEQTGLVLPLTLAVLNGCLRQQRRWRQAGRIVPVAVNLTPRWLLDDRFPQVLQLALRGWEGRPGELTLEAKESAISAEPGRAQAVLDAVARLGCRISIDDFGTGYSCLAHLQRLPVAELKIDRGFVADMASSRNAAVVVRGIVRLAHGLGLRVVAEGVETPEAATWLGTLGCDELQGFLFGRPMPADDLERWLTRPPASPAAGPPVADRVDA